MLSDRDLNRYANDIVAWSSEQYILAETGFPIQLAPHQRRILSEITRRDAEGRFKYETILYSCPKKSGKTEIASLFSLWYAIFVCEAWGEIYICANDLEQSQGRIFQAVVKALRSNPVYGARITAREIEFPTGTKITALASEYAGAAGSNPSLTAWSELWGYTSESSRRLYEELTPVPTRKNSLRIIETYAGFEGESELLKSLYDRGMEGELLWDDLPCYQNGRLFCYWDHEARMAWQTPEYYDEQRKTLRTNQYLRLHENQWVSGESQFITLAQWRACYRGERASGRVAVVGGLDASVKRDYTALVFVSKLAGDVVQVVDHALWKPVRGGEIDIGAVERAILDFKRRYRISAIYFDPYQASYLAQRLAGYGVPMKEFPQTPQNLTRAASALYELVKDGRLIAYEHADFESQISHAVAIETARGWRLAKEKTSSRIDLIAALSFACAGAQDERSTNAWGIRYVECVVKGAADLPAVLGSGCPLKGGFLRDSGCRSCGALWQAWEGIKDRDDFEEYRSHTAQETVARFARRHGSFTAGAWLTAGPSKGAGSFTFKR